MRTIHTLGLAALLPALALAAAGHTGFASYLRQVPAVPRGAAEAHAAVLIDAGQIRQPAAFTTLFRKLEDEGVLAAMSGNPANPAGVTDAASAEAFQKQFDSMTPAQQMAMAQQMSAQMTGALQPSALGPEDRKVTTLLDQRQASAMARMEAGTRLQSEWIAALQRWEEAHRKITEEEYAALERTPMQCNKANDIDAAAVRVHAEFSARHLALVQGELKEGVGFFERRRVLATDDAGFADQLAPLMKKAGSPIARQGYASAQQDALRQITDLAGISWKLHEHAAYWWLNKLDDAMVHRCVGANA
jgi:hypothetical protein